MNRSSLISVLNSWLLGSHLHISQMSVDGRVGGLVDAGYDEAIKS